MKALPVIILNLFFCGITHAQRYAMLEMKNATETRWRFGHGLSMGEPTGVHLSFYKARDICKFRKHFLFEIYATQEGLLLGAAMAKLNPAWERSGYRAGASYIWYLPFTVLDSRLYIGAGAEGGTRTLEQTTAFETDGVAKVGVEWTFLIAKLTRRTNSVVSFYMEAKYQHSFGRSFRYLLPTVGLRFHYI